MFGAAQGAREGGRGGALPPPPSWSAHLHSSSRSHARLPAHSTHTTRSPSPPPHREIKLATSVTDFFHSDGYLAENKFRNTVSKLLSQVGAAACPLGAGSDDCFTPVACPHCSRFAWCWVHMWCGGALHSPALRCAHARGAAALASYAHVDFTRLSFRGPRLLAPASVDLLTVCLPLCSLSAWMQAQRRAPMRSTQRNGADSGRCCGRQVGAAAAASMQRAREAARRWWAVPQAAAAGEGRTRLGMALQQHLKDQWHAGCHFGCQRHKLPRSAGGPGGGGGRRRDIHHEGGARSARTVSAHTSTTCAVTGRPGGACSPRICHTVFNCYTVTVNAHMDVITLQSHCNTKRAFPTSPLSAPPTTSQHAR